MNYKPLINLVCVEYQSETSIILHTNFHRVAGFLRLINSYIYEAFTPIDTLISSIWNQIFKLKNNEEINNCGRLSYLYSILY